MITSLVLVAEFGLRFPTGEAYDGADGAYLRWSVAMLVGGFVVTVLCATATPSHPADSAPDRASDARVRVQRLAAVLTGSYGLALIVGQLTHYFYIEMLGFTAVPGLILLACAVTVYRQRLRLTLTVAVAVWLGLWGLLPLFMVFLPLFYGLPPIFNYWLPIAFSGGPVILWGLPQVAAAVVVFLRRPLSPWAGAIIVCLFVVAELGVMVTLHRTHAGWFYRSQWPFVGGIIGGLAVIVSSALALAWRPPQSDWERTTV
jgi:hypothetical protein